jgi:tryptophan synthase beta chain
MSGPTKILLDESEMPQHWYNLIPDLPSPPPPVLHPGTHEPVGPDDLAPLFPMALIAQEVSAEREVEIPEPVRRAYARFPPPVHPTYLLPQHGQQSLGWLAATFYLPHFNLLGRSAM